MLSVTRPGELRARTADPHRSQVWLMGRLQPAGCGLLGDELADPAHPPGGRVRVVGFLCHPAGAAADAELLHGALAM